MNSSTEMQQNEIPNTITTKISVSTTLNQRKTASTN